MLSTTRYPPAFYAPPSLMRNVLTKKSTTLIHDSRKLRSVFRSNVTTVTRHRIATRSIIINVATKNAAPCIGKTVQTTGRLNTGAIFVTYIPTSRTPARTSVSVHLLIKPRLLTNSAHLGTNAIAGVTLGVLSAKIVIQLNGICNGHVMSITIAGAGLHSHTLHVLYSLASLSHATTTSLLSHDNRRIGLTLVVRLKRLSTRATRTHLTARRKRLHRTLSRSR